MPTVNFGPGSWPAVPDGAAVLVIYDGGGENDLPIPCGSGRRYRRRPGPDASRSLQFRCRESPNPRPGLPDVRRLPSRRYRYTSCVRRDRRRPAARLHCVGTQTRRPGSNVAEATHTVADPRAGHYWDGNGYLLHAYDRTLDLGQDPWDVYLLYGPEARWESSDPPAPAYWMNQLGGANGPTLDSQTFADHARALLRQPVRLTRSGR
jgi:hypothetical protein